MKAEDLPLSDSVPKLKYILTCAISIVASIFSYSSAAFLVLMVLWPYESFKDLTPRVIIFFSGICTCITLGVLLSFGKTWVIKIFKGLVITAILISLFTFSIILFTDLYAQPINGLKLSSFFILFNLLLALLFFSKLLKTSSLVIKRHKRRHKKQLHYIKDQL
ncbi:hypothetical protein [Pseudoalteromonas shioyasakiensis]|uniref:hypothetical protein n=1 Tax=Pseudoalteromonas shioyasakiensis TaxID=1190813 RepID=UPI001C3E7FE9|nr:hypothetical protein [Pseudoalteromonas shioyasakiensis]